MRQAEEIALEYDGTLQRRKRRWMLSPSSLKEDEEDEKQDGFQTACCLRNGTR